MKEETEIECNRNVPNFPDLALGFGHYVYMVIINLFRKEDEGRPIGYILTYHKDIAFLKALWSG